MAAKDYTPEILSVGCPYCGVKPGSRCRPSGYFSRRVISPHKPRLEAAKQKS